MIKYQHQLIQGYNPSEGIYGDCFRTCVAILVGKDAIDVPHFVEEAILAGLPFEAADESARLWLAQCGYKMMNIGLSADQEGVEQIISSLTQDMPYILTVQSSRYECAHCIIARNLTPVWCPTDGKFEPGAEVQAWYDEANDIRVWGLDIIVKSVEHE